ncbi:MAG: amino acid racemase [Bacteroidota bacterium]|nr:MAG: amino acid racemase [Bacteroidota bacterium]
MKKLGLIGGIGPESSIEYYRQLIKAYQETAGTTDYPEMVMHSIDLTALLAYINANQPEELVGFLAERINVLDAAGCDFGAMASNTPHMVFDSLQKKVDLPLVSIVEVTCQAIAQSGLTKVALLGTRFTMSQGFYQKAAEKYGIEVVSPVPDQQEFIHRIYMGELLFNRIVPETKKQLLRIVSDIKEKEAIQGLILGGTELPLILHQSDFSGLQVFDTTQIHVASLVKRMTESK